MSKTSLRILVILASVRPHRRGDSVLSWWLSATAGTAEACGVRVDVADLRETGLAMDDEPDEPQAAEGYRAESTIRWSRRVKAADAVVVVTPEYNHSFPASLKNAFDHLSAEWQELPVAWVGYGNTSAGTRALLGAKQVAHTLGMRSVGPDVAIRLSDVQDGALRHDPSRDRAAQAALVALARAARRHRRTRPEIEVVGLAPDLVATLAGPDDAAEMLVLQRACWVEEATVNQTLALPALHETEHDVAQTIAQRDVLVVRRGDRLVAAVQWWKDGTTRSIGRLMVAPDQRGLGMARALLAHAESHGTDGIERLQLSTGTRSARNLAAYRARGYVEASHDDLSVTLHKPVAAPRI
ncbi:bifunctional NAD(P)H-dependent oxidoreductase/GNAT family N-acetyltransferase [Alteromonas gracilis]